MAGAPEGEIFDVEVLTKDQLQPSGDVLKQLEVSRSRTDQSGVVGPLIAESVSSEFVRHTHCTACVVIVQARALQVYTSSPMPC